MKREQEVKISHQKSIKIFLLFLHPPTVYRLFHKLDNKGQPKIITNIRGIYREEETNKDLNLIYKIYIL